MVRWATHTYNKLGVFFANISDTIYGGRPTDGAVTSEVIAEPRATIRYVTAFIVGAAVGLWLLVGLPFYQ
jgi:hypothetical protein